MHAARLQPSVVTPRQYRRSQNSVFGGRMANSSRAKNSWVAFPCGVGLCKGGPFLIHAGQSEEEPTLCKNHPSTELRAGPSAGLRASKGAAPGMHLGRFAKAMSNRSHLAPVAEGTRI